MGIDLCFPLLVVDGNTAKHFTFSCPPSTLIGGQTVVGRGSGLCRLSIDQLGKVVIGLTTISHVPLLGVWSILAAAPFRC
jgi:hypothetical protein